MAQMTEEELRKLSPEQLRQLQKQHCIFCQIVEKKVQSRVIYEDDKALAILDINPANPGHILLLPKEHYSVSPQMPDELGAHLGMIAKQLGAAQLRAIGSEGTSIVLANGLAAGQRASHLMLHVIPRKAGDKVGITLPPSDIDNEALDAMQRQLAPIVAKAFGTEVVSAPSVRGDVPAPPPKPETIHATRTSATPTHRQSIPPPSPRNEEDVDEGKQATSEAQQKKEERKEQPAEGKKKKLGRDATLDDIASLLLGGKR